MADSTYRPRVYRQRGGSKFVAATGGEINADGGTFNVNSGGTLNVKAAGALALATGSKWTRAVRTATQGLTFVAADSGITTIFQVANLLNTLPNATAVKGGQYRIVLGTGGLAATGGAGLRVKVSGSDKIRGNGLSSPTGTPQLTLAAATDAIGDFVDLFAGGSTSWYIVGSRGSWSLGNTT
jgi:hypothetical protein